MQNWIGKCEVAINPTKSGTPKEELALIASMQPPSEAERKSKTLKVPSTQKAFAPLPVAPSTLALAPAPVEPAKSTAPSAPPVAKPPAEPAKPEQKRRGFTLFGGFGRGAKTKHSPSLEFAVAKREEGEGRKGGAERHSGGGIPQSISIPLIAQHLQQQQIAPTSARAPTSQTQAQEAEAHLETRAVVGPSLVEETPGAQGTSRETQGAQEKGPGAEVSPETSTEATSTLAGQESTASWPEASQAVDMEHMRDGAGEEGDLGGDEAGAAVEHRPPVDIIISAPEDTQTPPSPGEGAASAGEFGGAPAADDAPSGADESTAGPSTGTEHPST